MFCLGRVVRIRNCGCSLKATQQALRVNRSPQVSCLRLALALGRGSDVVCTGSPERIAGRSHARAGRRPVNHAFGGPVYTWIPFPSIKFVIYESRFFWAQSLGYAQSCLCVFRARLVSKNFHLEICDFFFEHMHGALNVIK